MVPSVLFHTWNTLQVWSFDESTQAFSHPFSDKLVLLSTLDYYQVNLILNYFSEKHQFGFQIFGNDHLVEPDSGGAAVTLEQMMKVPVVLFTETLGATRSCAS